MIETKNEPVIDSNGRVVLSIRIRANEKIRLQGSANALGLTLSDYVESTLVNNREDAALRTETASLKQECELLKQTVATLESQTTIFRDPQLLNHLDRVKGISDVIETPDGKKYPITYNTVTDVLIAFIYSFKLK